MPTRRSSKATIALVRSFSTNSRPALRAAACGGRPRAGSDTTATPEPASPCPQQVAMSDGEAGADTLVLVRSGEAVPPTQIVAPDGIAADAQVGLLDKPASVAAHRALAPARPGPMAQVVSMPLDRYWPISLICRLSGPGPRRRLLWRLPEVPPRRGAPWSDHAWPVSHSGAAWSPHWSYRSGSWRCWRCTWRRR